MNRIDYTNDIHAMNAVHWGCDYLEAARRLSRIASDVNSTWFDMLDKVSPELRTLYLQDDGIILGDN